MPLPLYRPMVQPDLAVRGA